MITRSGQDLMEKFRQQREKRKGVLATLKHSPNLARIARHLANKLVWTNHAECYGDEICSYCHHQEEVAAAMVLFARSHARRALRGHVFDNEIEAAVRDAERKAKRGAKR